MKNRFVKLAGLFLIFSALAVSVTAQTNCVLADAPKLLGLSLGDSPAQVQSVFGKALKIKIKDKGDRTFFQNYIEKSGPNALRGVRALYLRFLDGKLYQIEIFYEDRSDWQTLSDFTANISMLMNLTGNNWQLIQNKAVIECGEFSIIADKILNPRILLTDKATQSKADELHKAEKEKGKRKKFR